MDYLRRYKNIYDENIILLYKGELNFELVSSIIETIEERVEALETERKVKKKFYNVATECIQNLYYHIEEVQSEEGVISEYDSKAALVMITVRKRFYSLLTGNYIPNDRIDIIRKKIENINSASQDELRDMYKKVLLEENGSEKKTAGLGFIDIARKSGQSLAYNFYPVNDDFSYFTFQAKLKRSAA